jgi:hypothetical protein
VVVVVLEKLETLMVKEKVGMVQLLQLLVLQ